MYTLRKAVSREDGVRALLPENAYIQKLREAEGVFEIGNVLVDRAQLIDRRFLCDSLHCMRYVPSRKRYRGCCCTDLEVDLTPNELLAMRRCCSRYLASDGADAERPEYRIARRVLETEEWQDANYRGEPYLTHSREKVCSMGYIARDGRLLCGLNAMAEALGEPVARWKPATCYVFPLHYVEYRPGHYLLTVVCGENHEYIDAAEEIGRLACLKKPQTEAPPAYVALRGEIEWLFGAPFYEKLRQLAQAQQG